MVTLSLLGTGSGDTHLACSGWRPAQCHRSTHQSAGKSEHQIMLITCRRSRRSTQRCYRHGFYSCCSWRTWITDSTAAQHHCMHGSTTLHMLRWHAPRSAAPGSCRRPLLQFVPSPRYFPAQAQGRGRLGVQQGRHWQADAACSACAWPWAIRTLLPVHRLSETHAPH